MRTLHPSTRVGPSNIRFNLARNQRGAVLVVSLLLLLVMTLLGLGASQSTRLQERMAGNQRDLELAMQGAEAALRAAEYDVRPQDDSNDFRCQRPTEERRDRTLEDGCMAYSSLLSDANDNPLDLTKQTDEWWQENAEAYENASTDLSVVGTPQYVEEYLGEIRDSLSEGSSYVQVSRDLYRATGRSSGMTDTAEVIVQSTYARVVVE